MIETLYWINIIALLVIFYMLNKLKDKLEQMKGLLKREHARHNKSMSKVQSVNFGDKRRRFATNKKSHRSTGMPKVPKENRR